MSAVSFLGWHGQTGTSRLNRRQCSDSVVVVVMLVIVAMALLQLARGEGGAVIYATVKRAAANQHWFKGQRASSICSATETETGLWSGCLLQRCCLSLLVCRLPALCYVSS